jgi:hypothetical protein
MERWKIEELWQRPHVDGVLSHHNSTYGTNLVVKGRYESVYGHVKNGKQWDWVCRDSLTGLEAAIEIKQLTSEDLEERHSILWQEIGGTLKNLLSSKLPGTFVLSMAMPEKRPMLPKATKEELVAHLEKEIKSVVPHLKPRENHQLAVQSELKPDLLFSVMKLDDSGAELYLSSHSFQWGSPLKDNELFKTLVKLLRDANRQLGEAKRRGIQQTFFIITEQLLSKSDIKRVQNTLYELVHRDCADINFCYLVSPGRTPNVQELTLPSGQSKHGEFIKEG